MAKEVAGLIKLQIKGGAAKWASEKDRLCALKGVRSLSFCFPVNLQ